ncbi:MAG: hypothetical protein WAM98_18975 [Terriglobales bacterium]
MTRKAFAPDCDVPLASASSAVSPSSATASSVNPWWGIGDFGVFGLWIAIVGFTLSYHEKWMDEAQAWLFARDLDLYTLWFHELRYEGSPGLWHTILWVAQHVFHARYGAIGPIGMICAAAGVALLIFKAPFPRIVRWPLAFTYFMVYQYAVIARQYVLLPLFAFAAAILFKDRMHPGRMTLVLVLLANVSFHGTLLAGCLGLAYLMEAMRSWRTLERPVRNRYLICTGVMVITFVFLFIVLKPAPDSIPIIARGRLLHPPAWRNQHGQDITLSVRVATMVSGAFFDYLAPSVIFLVLAAVWCFLRGRLLVFLLPVGLEIALYAFLYGTVHHHGTAFVAAITGLWIAWPSDHEQRTLPIHESRALQGMIVLLLCLCAVNIWDAAVVIKREYLYPYCGAEDAANYLKAVGADHGSIFGYDFGISAVQAYFDRNILANISTSYTHNGLTSQAFTFDADELERVKPEYVVVYTKDPKGTMQENGPRLASLGYELVHFSDGYYFYKRVVPNRESYLILRRIRPGAGQAPAQAQN